MLSKSTTCRPSLQYIDLGGAVIQDLDFSFLSFVAHVAEKMDKESSLFNRDVNYQLTTAAKETLQRLVIRGKSFLKHGLSKSVEYGRF